jgi:hypothetical protein
MDHVNDYISIRNATENTLILYYDNNKKYLQFEKVNN